MRRAAAVLLCLAALSCTAPPDATLPEWAEVPAAVLNSLCTRLRMDAIGTSGRLVFIDTTQPFVTPAAIGNLSATARSPVTWERASRAIQEANRSLPVRSGSGPCEWSPLAAAQRAKLTDEMIVEISAPMVNPAFPSQAGIFARASVGPQEEWYWISLVRSGAAWGVRQVNVLPR
jgi:hypothetical protein